MVLLSSIVASISLPAPSYAATASSATPEEQVKAFLYFRSLQSCLYQGAIFNRIGGNYSSGYISTEDANGGAWFKSNTNKRVLPRADGHFYDCGDADWIRDMISLYGYGSGGEMLTAIGFDRNGDADYTAKFQDVIANNLGGNIAKKWGKEPPLEGAGSYYFFYSLFTDTKDGCGATRTNDAGLADSNKGVRISKMIDPATGALTPDGQNIAFAYKSGTTGTDEVAVFNEARGGYKSMTCRQIAQNISDNAPAAAAYYRSHPDQAKNLGSITGDPTTGNKATCAVEGIGWLICPVVTVMSKITDQSYTLVSSLLVVQPLSTAGGNASLYDAWTKMRNIANVLFAIAFLVIMYAQITSMGISNYGVKKLLPKLIICAILVNVSFWLCAIAVDISNIIGASFNGLFGSQIPVSAYKEDLVTQGNGWTGLAAAVLGGAIAVYAGLSVLLPALVMVLVTIVTVFVGLILRQALIILLIVVSPIAFVAYLLPNTEGLFKKWKDMFKALLVVYPVIGVLFGASHLSSVIIMNSAAGITDPVIRVATQTAGAAAAILPLLLIKTIISGATSLISRVTGFVNNPNKGPFDRMKKGAQKFREDSNVSRRLRALDPNKRSMFGRRQVINFRNRRNAVSSGRAEQLSELQKEQVAQAAVTDDKFAEKVAGQRAPLYQARQQSYLDSINPDKIMLDVDKAQIQSATSRLTLSVKDPANKAAEMQKALTDAVKANDAITARAAQEILMGMGNKGADTLRSALMGVNATSDVGVQLRKDIASSNMKGRAADVYAWSVDGAHRSLKDVGDDAKTWEGLSDKQGMGQVEGAMKAAVSSGGFSPARAQSILTAQGAEEIGQKEGDILRNHAISGGYTPPAP